MRKYSVKHLQCHIERNNYKPVVFFEIELMCLHSMNKSESFISIPKYSTTTGRQR